jgi:hypothetical protein
MQVCPIGEFWEFGEFGRKFTSIPATKLYTISDNNKHNNNKTRKRQHIVIVVLNGSFRNINWQYELITSRVPTYREVDTNTWLFLIGHSASSASQTLLGLYPTCTELEYRFCKTHFVGVFPPFDPRKDTNFSFETLRYFSNIVTEKV